ncbi:(2Fe-2S)-binding protein [Kitasatospora sp. NPDC059327]|uniref:(2Fe-2S)-binding protein n=1 Tax=Kitasatospora sp. NPDC059327 TaxID=3346803 RepID=UPI0036B6C39D
MTASSTRPGPAPHAPRTTPAHAVAPSPAASPATPPAAPCTASYRRLGLLFPALRVRSAAPRTGDGWISGADLLAGPDALGELIAHDARQGLTRYGRPLRPDVAAGFGLHRFTWSAALLFTLPWFLERRVPLLTPADVSIRRATGELTARTGAFVCLTDDPAAGLPDARTVADEAALSAELRAALADFLTPVLTAFRPAVRRSPRMLWAMATDAVVEGLWYVGGLLGEEERARAELSDLLAPATPAAPAAPAAPATPATPAALAAPGAPEPSAPPAPPACTPGASAPCFTPGAGFATGSASGTDRARASCCLVYTVRPEEMCGGCPRVTRG